MQTVDLVIADIDWLITVDSGRRIIRDAAIAVQLVLTLVEPQSSGIGGGAFMLYHDGRQLQVFDGRETAPVRAGWGRCR